MKINKIIYLLVMFCFLTADGMTKTKRDTAFGIYLDKLEVKSDYRLTALQRQELERPRTMNDYDPNFFGTVEYKKRREYKDTSKNDLIAEWKKNCPGMLWRSDHELHHIVPLGYGGRNEWWNIFPLTFINHWQAGSGIHNTPEFRALFSSTAN